MTDIKATLREKADRIDLHLERFLPDEQTKADLLGQAVRYSVRAGGKRLRPILMIETAGLFSEKTPYIEEFACAMEMIHTFSLVHDDLPDMDNDSLRRGKPTTHTVYGPAQAILAGDALLNLAYEIMTDACLKSGQKNTVRAMAEIAKAVGIHGMTAGQSQDVMFEKTGKIPDMEQITYIHDKKCAELIRASMAAGAILSGASDVDINTCNNIGRSIGVAFQIIDDILDIQGDEKLLGKPVGSDAKNNKHTMATIAGIDRAQEQAKELTDIAIESLSSLPGDKTFLRELFCFLVKRDS